MRLASVSMCWRLDDFLAVNSVWMAELSLISLDFRKMILSKGTLHFLASSLCVCNLFCLLRTGRHLFALKGVLTSITVQNQRLLP